MEKIAMLLGVPIDIFFNEESQPSASATASGRNSVAAAGQGISVTHTSSPAGGENTALQEKVSSLEDQIALLKASLADKERTIQILMQNR